MPDHDLSPSGCIRDLYAPVLSTLYTVLGKKNGATLPCTSFQHHMLSTASGLAHNLLHMTPRDVLASFFTWPLVPSVSHHSNTHAAVDNSPLYIFYVGGMMSSWCSKLFPYTRVTTFTNTKSVYRHRMFSPTAIFSPAIADWAIQNHMHFFFRSNLCVS